MDRQSCDPESTAVPNYPVDRGALTKYTTDISDLLKQAFEKHKSVCRGFRHLEDELNISKQGNFKLEPIKVAPAVAAEDPLEMRKLKRENVVNPPETVDPQPKEPKDSKEKQPEAEAKLLPTSTESSTVEFMEYEEDTGDLKVDETPATVAEVKHRLEVLEQLVLDLKDELRDAKLKIKNLSTRVQDLQKEMKHWHHQFCHLKSETSIKSAQRALTATESVVSPKMSSEKAEKQKSPESCSGNTSFRKHNSSTLQINLNSDGEEDEDLPAKVADKGGDDKSSVKGALATINSTQVPGEVGMSETEPQQKTASASVDQNIQKVPWKRKRIGADDSAPKTPVKRLQTNTCKVCQAYWRAEDDRIPGQLKSNDLPFCKIHGKKRPPCTPENFWKQARHEGLDPDYYKSRDANV